MEKAQYRRVGATVYQGRTARGLRYALCPIKGAKQTSFGIVFAKGGLPDEESIDGTKVPLGTAHFLEHRMFQLEDGDAGEMFAALGASSNAVTTTSSTTYYFTTAGSWREPLELLARMCTSFYMTEQDVDREREIILRERERLLDEPSCAFSNRILEALYFYAPIREDIIGTPESLASVHASTLRKFFRRHYSLANMIVIGCGDFDPVEVAAALEKLRLYNGFQVLDALPRKLSEEPREMVYEPEVEIPSPDGQTYLGVGIKFPAREDLYTKYGDMLFAMYEILPDLVFSPALQPIDRMRKEGLLIYSAGASIEQAGEETCLTALFETNSPSRMKNQLERHLDNIPAGLTITGGELRKIELAYLGRASTEAFNPEELLFDMVDAFENHIVWPALASRAVTLKSRDVLSFLKSVSEWPRSYCVLRGRSKTGDDTQ